MLGLIPSSLKNSPIHNYEPHGALNHKVTTGWSCCLRVLVLIPPQLFSLFLPVNLSILLRSPRRQFPWHSIEPKKVVVPHQETQSVLPQSSKVMPRPWNEHPHVELFDRSMNLDDLNGDDEILDFSTNTLHVFQDDMERSESRDVPELLKPSVAGSKALLTSNNNASLSSLLEDDLGEESTDATPLPLHQRSAATRSASLNKSLQIATLLYESLSELARSSGDDFDEAADPLSCHSHRPPAGQGSGAARCANQSIVKANNGHELMRKDHLVGLLSNGLRDLEELENRHSCSSGCATESGGDATATATATYKHKMFEKQKLQLVNMLSKALSEIEQLEAAAAEQKPRATTPNKSAAPTRCCSTRRSKRRPSLGSDVSSITSRASSFYPDKPLDQLNAYYQLPKCLTPQTSAPTFSLPPHKDSAATTTKQQQDRTLRRRTSSQTPQTKLECDIDSTLQDSFTSFCTLDPEDAPPKRPQRRGSFGASGHGNTVEAAPSDLPSVPPSGNRSRSAVADSRGTPAATTTTVVVRRRGDSPPASPFRQRSSRTVTSLSSTQHTDTMHSDIYSLLDATGTQNAAAVVPSLSAVVAPARVLA